MLFQIFPIWIAVLSHKFLLVSFNLFGAYLLFNKGFKFNKLDSIFVASLISIINPYATYQSLQHGIGFAVIPFAIYVFLYTSTSKRYFIYTTLLSFLISISTSPLHSFQALLGGLVLTGFIRRPENIKFLLISILILLSFLFINWSEVLYGLMTYGQLTSRILSSENHMNLFGLLPHLINKSDYCFINCNYRYSPVAILTFIVLFSLVIKFKKEYVKPALFLIFCNFVPNLGWIFADLINFNTAKSMNFYEFSYYFIIPLSYLALKISSNNNNLLNKIPLVFFFLSITILLHDKIDFFKKTFFESQTKIYKINNLVEKKWKSSRLSRVVSAFPHDNFHPNFAWVYGFETSDGWTHFILNNYSSYWNYGVQKKKFLPGKYQYGGDLYIENNDLMVARRKNEEIKLNKFIDLNLLALSNTSFILSYIPLFDENLELISGPDMPPYSNINNINIKRDANFYIQELKKRGRFIKNPPDVYVYKIEKSSDRAFFPKKIIKLKNNLNPNEKYRYISSNYDFNTSFIIGKDENPATGTILKLKKVKDGYKIRVDVKTKGIFALNSFYIPYWKVLVNNEQKNVINLGDVHMGVMLEEGAYNLDFIYDRILLREKIFNFF